MSHQDRSRIATAVYLLSAPVTLVVSERMYVSMPDDVKQGLALGQSHHVTQLWASLLGLLAAALFVPLVHILAELPTTRGRRWAQVGNVLATLGVVGYAAHSGMFIVFGQAANQADDRAAMARLITAMDGNAGAGVVLLLFLGGLYLGLVLLMVGAARAGAVPWWSASCVIAAVAAAFVPVAAAEYAAQILVVVGFAGAAWAMARTGTEDVVERRTTGSPSLA